MTSKAGKHKHELVNIDVEIEEEPEELEDAPAHPSSITTKIYLKPLHPSEKMDKDVILRRIRPHKRMNKLRRAAEALCGSTFSTTVNTKPKIDRGELPQRWVDDAFAAL